MLTAIFIIAAMFLGFKLIGFAFRTAWRAGAVILLIALIPVIALVLFFGLIWIAFPILLIIGSIVLIVKAVTWG